MDTTRMKHLRITAERAHNGDPNAVTLRMTAVYEDQQKVELLPTTLRLDSDDHIDISIERMEN